jgi:hypothetical protein
LAQAPFLSSKPDKVCAAATVTMVARQLILPSVTCAWQQQLLWLLCCFTIQIKMLEQMRNKYWLEYKDNIEISGAELINIIRNS